jgi:nicotinate-nucleotide adenylyltransferase
MPEPCPPNRPVASNGIGVLGGAFNPPHRTHLRLAQTALTHLPIQEVRVVPAGDHPHKRGHDMAPAADRLAMCRLQFAGIPRVVVDDRELRRTGPSFTVDTLGELAAEQPARPIFFLIGSDNLPLLPTWRDVHGIFTRCTVVTWPRAGYPIDAKVVDALPLHAHERAALLANVLPLPADAVAASDLRARWRQGSRDVSDLLPDVRDYIAAHGLYR